MTTLGIMGVTTPAERLKRGGVGGFNLPSAPLRPGHHHIDFAGAALGADQPFAPIGHGRFCALPSGHLGGIVMPRRY
jgi:hypothetical protein